MKKIINTIYNIYKEVEQILGSLKFAVFIILTFATALIVGTFQESYHGTDYANRLIYKSAWFIIIQILMFLSILMATLIRLPYQHRLRGFYTLHLGLLTLFIGSFVTYDKGIDGTMTLMPLNESHNLSINEDQLIIVDKSSGESVELDLPYTAKSKHIDLTWKEFTVLDYLPFAEKKISWIKTSQAQTSAQYQIQNAMFSEKITLSLNENSAFKSSDTLGLLNVHLLPPELYECFTAYPKDTLLFWDADKNQCLGLSSPLVKKISQKPYRIKISDKLRSVNFEFSPDLSPLPVKNNQPDQTAPWRMFNRSLFEKNPHLIFFGQALAFYNKDDSQWHHHRLTKDPSFSVELPWMGFKTSLIHFDQYAYPSYEPEFTIPIQDNNQIIHGKERAIQLKISNPMGEKVFWLYLDQTLNVQLKDKSYEVALRKKTHPLPFSLRLTKFELKTDPGTQNAASYESFVTLAAPNKPLTQHHIYMNNPLKYEQLTFYQASYFETENGYGSVLSVNYDPGRWIKYIGAILLIFGSIWHFFMIRRRELMNKRQA